MTEALVKAADDAMYVSKRSEKNKVVVSETLTPLPGTSPLAEGVPRVCTVLE
jgi:hypothetical protein